MDVDFSTAFEAIKNSLSLFRDAITVVKGAKDLMPVGTDKETVEKSLMAAERAGHLAEAQIAQALGYRLCRCTFPPQIMLSHGDDRSQERFQCPKCNKSWPPPQIDFPKRRYGAP